MDDLARQVVIARGDTIGHQNSLNELSQVDLHIIDGFLAAGIVPNTSSDLFTVPADWDYRLSTIIVSQSGPAYYIETFPPGLRGLRSESHGQPLTHNQSPAVNTRGIRSREAEAGSEFWE
jgi:hypothetical protein